MRPILRDKSQPDIIDLVLLGRIEAATELLPFANIPEEALLAALLPVMNERRDALAHHLSDRADLWQHQHPDRVRYWESRFESLLVGQALREAQAAALAEAPVPVNIDVPVEEIETEDAVLESVLSEEAVVAARQAARKRRFYRDLGPVLIWAEQQWFGERRAHDQHHRDYLPQSAWARLAQSAHQRIADADAIQISGGRSAAVLAAILVAYLSGQINQNGPAMQTVNAKRNSLNQLSLFMIRYVRQQYRARIWLHGVNIYSGRQDSPAMKKASGGR